MVAGRPMLELIPALSKGFVPPGRAEPARVKPQGKKSVGETVEDFKKFCFEEFNRLNSAVADGRASSAPPEANPRN